MTGPQYTVKQVAQAIGVSPATVRVWERRYGVVTPARSPSQYRLFDTADLARLRRMAALVRAGHPASLAASQVLADPPPEAVEHDRDVAGGAVDPSAAVQHDRLVVAGQTLDTPRPTQVLDEAWSQGSFETVLEHWLVPAMTAVGDAWAAGRLNVAGEHFVAAGVHRRLAASFEAAGTAHDAPVLLTGLPAGARHQLGSLAFSTCARRCGLDVVHLGADVPLDSWLHAVRTARPAGVAVSVPRQEDLPAVADLTRALTADHPRLPLWVGGAAADRLPSTPEPGVFAVLPVSGAQAAAEVASVLTGS